MSVILSLITSLLYWLMLALSAHLTGLFLEDTRLQILSPKGKHIYFSNVAICSLCLSTVLFKRRQASKPITPRLNNGTDNVSEDRQILIIVHGEVKVNKMIRWSEICFWVSPRGENRRLGMIFRAPGLFYQGFKLLVPSNAARLSPLSVNGRQWSAFLTVQCFSPSR